MLLNSRRQFLAAGVRRCCCGGGLGKSSGELLSSALSEWLTKFPPKCSQTPPARLACAARLWRPHPPKLGFFVARRSQFVQKRDGRFPHHVTTSHCSIGG